MSNSIPATSNPKANPPFPLAPTSGLKTTSECKEDCVFERATKTKVLLVDDEKMLVQLLERFLELSALPSSGFTEPELALQWFDKNHSEVAVAILDLKMSKIDGRECYLQMRKIDPEVKVCFLSGSIEKELEAELLQMGALRFFKKPLRYPELVNWVKTLINHPEAAKQRV